MLKRVRARIKCYVTCTATVLIDEQGLIQEVEEVEDVEDTEDAEMINQIGGQIGGNIGT
jgi:hypothetical protein